MSKNVIFVLVYHRHRVLDLNVRMVSFCFAGSLVGVKLASPAGNLTAVPAPSPPVLWSSRRKPGKYQIGIPASVLCYVGNDSDGQI
jgi:hypothetical protein